MTTKRDYKKEYREYHGKPEQIAARSQRNAARAKVRLAVGDKREVDHKNPISKGGSNRKDNLRAVARSTNRSKGSSRK
jgi:5-methylcytosine-specific restriction endonuclease McrA